MKHSMATARRLALHSAATPESGSPLALASLPQWERSRRLALRLSEFGSVLRSGDVRDHDLRQLPRLIAFDRRCQPREPKLDHLPGVGAQVSADRLPLTRRDDRQQVPDAVVARDLHDRRGLIALQRRAQR